MKNTIISAAAIAVMAITSTAALAVAQAPAKASSPATTTSPTTSTSYSPKSAGPTVEATRLGVKQTSNASRAPAAYDAHIGAGRNIALMVVGGAALIIGAVIGGAPGLLIGVAGAAVGLYGLYYFIQ